MAIHAYPWKDNPLEYLVGVRFPLERHYKISLFSLSNRSAPVRNDAYLKQASDYRSELEKLSETELLERAEAAAKSEVEKGLAKAREMETQQFFNLPGASTDIAHWSRMSLWTIEEAVALSLGKDPRRVNWENVRSHVQISAFAAAYQARRDIILRAKLAGQLWDSTIPGVFIAWAARMNVELPAPLVNAVKELGVQISDWKSAYEQQKRVAEAREADFVSEQKTNIQLLSEHAAYIKKLSADYGNLIDAHRSKIAMLEAALEQQREIGKNLPAEKPIATEKPFGMRERESLLKLVIGMAIKGYVYDPKVGRTSATKDIADDLERAGVPLDQDTVRKYLNEAKEFLPPSVTE